jgi:hypothetical protein
MKTQTTTIAGAYTCDGCPGTASSNSPMPPAGWKSFQVMLRPASSPAKANQSIDLCATCAAPANANGIAALAKLLN